MIRDTPFYVVQFTCSLTLIVVSYIFYPHQLDENTNLEMESATIRYISIMLLNGLLILKLLSEFLNKPTTELWASVFLRNITSLSSFAVGMIVLGNTYISCDLCELILILIPSVALVADVFNTNEDLLLTRGMASFNNWIRPAELESMNYWSMMFLYILNICTLGWVLVVYYLQNEAEERSIYEENYLMLHIIIMSVILVKFLILFFGRWFIPKRDYAPLSGKTENNITFAAAINAPLLTYIFDISILGLLSFFFGMLEKIERYYNNKGYMIIMVEVCIGLSIIKILIGKNKV